MVTLPGEEKGVAFLLAAASDWTDVVLFAAIAAFAVSVALAVESTGLRSLSSVAALACAVRALVLLLGNGTLELASLTSLS